MPAQAAQRKAWNEAMRSAAGVSALPKSLQKTNRRSDRRKRGRASARSTTTVAASSGHDDDDDDDDYRAAVWIDAIEQVNQDDEGEAEQEEEYNELEDLQPNQRKRRKPKKTKVGQMPKRFKPRSLASILQEETTRHDGVAQAFVEAGRSTTTLPHRPYCPVTGLPGVYREPKSGLCYANDRALEQIRERAPPWRNLTGAAAYNDIVKSIVAATETK